MKSYYFNLLTIISVILLVGSVTAFLTQDDIKLTLIFSAAAVATSLYQTHKYINFLEKSHKNNIDNLFEIYNNLYDNYKLKNDIDKEKDAEKEDIYQIISSIKMQLSSINQRLRIQPDLLRNIDHACQLHAAKLSDIDKLLDFIRYNISNLSSNPNINNNPEVPHDFLIEAPKILKEISILKKNISESKKVITRGNVNNVNHILRLEKLVSILLEITNSGLGPGNYSEINFYSNNSYFDSEIINLSKSLDLEVHDYKLFDLSDNIIVDRVSNFYFNNYEGLQPLYPFLKQSFGKPGKVIEFSIKDEKHRSLALNFLTLLKNSRLISYFDYSGGKNKKVKIVSHNDPQIKLFFEELWLIRFVHKQIVSQLEHHSVSYTSLARCRFVRKDIISLLVDLIYLIDSKFYIIDFLGKENFLSKYNNMTKVQNSKIIPVEKWFIFSINLDDKKMDSIKNSDFLNLLNKENFIEEIISVIVNSSDKSNSLSE